MTKRCQTTSLPSPSPGLLQGASLFLDFDGTLVSIAARPDAVAVEEHVRSLLVRLQIFLHGRLAVVSGRAAADIEELLGDTDLVIAGSHGAELCRGPGKPTPWGMPLDGVAWALLDGLRTQHPGVLIEEKPSGLALHYRPAPEAAAACHEIAAQIAARTGHVVQPGKMVVELRMAGYDKGTALTTLMREPPMQGGTPIFVGDDETDEAGFKAATNLGGAGILVGEQRPTQASFRLPDVDGTLLWLETALRGAQ